MRFALFITCLTETFRPRAGVAVVKVLEHLGHEVVFPEEQTCCGQPMYTAGSLDDARHLARRMIAVFEDHGTVVTPSGSCAAMVRAHFPGLFPPGSADRAAADALAARTFEFVDLLTDVLHADLAALGVRGTGTATCHDACHLRSLGQAGAVERLARTIDGLACVPLEGREQCCGFGGAFAVLYPQISAGMVRQKVDAIRATGADTVITGETGCVMSLAGACRRAGVDVEFRSLAEIIAEGLGLLDGGEPG